MNNLSYSKEAKKKQLNAIFGIIIIFTLIIGFIIIGIIDINQDKEIEQYKESLSICEKNELINIDNPFLEGNEIIRFCNKDGSVCDRLKYKGVMYVIDN